MERKVTPDLFRSFHWKKNLVARYFSEARFAREDNSKAFPTANDGAKKQKLKSSPSVTAQAVDQNNNNLANVPTVFDLDDNGHGDKKRKLPTKPNGGGSEYRTSPDPSQTVTATFHQKSARRGLSKYRGAQCTSMALAAVLTSTCLPLDAWNTSDLDAVLRYGDRLHQHLISRVDRRSTDPRLALHEIPAGEGFTYMVPSPIQGDKWFAENYPHTVIKTMSKSLDFYGPVNSAKPCRHGDFADLGDTALQQALEIVLHGNFDGAVITVGNVSGAVIQDGQGRIRYFDSHSNNKIGRMTLDGTAVLLTFDTVQEFVRYIRKRESNPHVRYELIGIRLNAC